MSSSNGDRPLHAVILQLGFGMDKLRQIPIRTVGLLATVLTSVMLSSCGGGPPATAGGPPPVPVQVELISATSVEDRSEFVGVLEARERVILRPEISGRIVAITVEAGDRVDSGMLLVQLRPDRSRSQLDSAIASANAAQASRQSADAQLRAARAELARAEAELELQRAEYSRTEQLVAEGAQSLQQLDVAQRDLDTAIASVTAAQDQVNAARANLEQATSVLRQADAQADVASEDLQFTRILSPIAGIVGDFDVKVGDYVENGDTLTSIIQNDFLDLRIPVPSNRANELRIGLPVELVDPATGQPLASGSVNFISPEVDSTAQTVLVKARFSNPTGTLRDGQFVQARIIWERTSGVLIPTIAVSRLGGQNFVYVLEEVTEDGETRTIVRQHPVQLGNLQGQRYEVLEGLEAGDRIAISNILKLGDEAPVEPIAADTPEAPAAPES